MSCTGTQQAPRTVSLEVLKAVAMVENEDPTALEPPLYEAVEPDALDRLFAHSAGLESVSFEYRGHVVTVYADGGVEID